MKTTTNKSCQFTQPDCLIAMTGQNKRLAGFCLSFPEETFYVWDARLIVVSTVLSVHCIFLKVLAKTEGNGGQLVTNTIIILPCFTQSIPRD